MANVTATFTTIIYGTQENAMLGFRHNGTYGQFKLTNLEILPASPVNASTTGTVTFGTRDITRITGVSGGVDVPYVHINRDGADLPSQVLIRRRPDQVTFSTPNKYRRFLPFPVSIATPLFLKRWAGTATIRDGTGTWWRAGHYDSNVQAITLREGEGLALSSSDANPVYPQTLLLTLMIRNLSTSDTYTVSTQFHPSEMAGAGFALLNGSGSGIVLKVEKIEVSDIGEPTLSTTPPLARLVRIFKLIGGKDIAPIFMDRGDSSLIPSGFLVVKRNLMQDDLTVLYQNDIQGGPNAADLGYPSTYTIGLVANAPYVDTRSIFRRVGLLANRYLVPLGIAQPNLALVGLNPSIQQKWSQYGLNYGGRQDINITCNPNEGIAVILSNSSTFGEFYVEITIEWTPYTVENKAPILGQHLITYNN